MQAVHQPTMSLRALIAVGVTSGDMCPTCKAPQILFDDTGMTNGFGPDEPLPPQGRDSDRDNWEGVEKRVRKDGREFAKELLSKVSLISEDTLTNQQKVSDIEAVESSGSDGRNCEGMKRLVIFYWHTVCIP